MREPAAFCARRGFDIARFDAAGRQHKSRCKEERESGRFEKFHHFHCADQIMPGQFSRTKIFVLAAVIVLTGVSAYRVTKGPQAGNPRQTVISVLPENEKRFGQDFEYFYPFEEPRGMIPMTLTGPGGKTARLDDFRGQVVLVHFWATWCPPCIKELPTLKALQDKSEGKNLKIVTVSLDYGKRPEQIFEFMKKHKVETLPAYQVLSSDKSWNDLSGFGLPTSFLVGADGRVLYKMVGDTDWSSPVVQAFIEDILTN